MMKLLLLTLSVVIGCASQIAQVDSRQQTQNREAVISCEYKDADFATVIEVEIPNEFNNTWKFYYRNASSLQGIQQNESDGPLFNDHNMDGFGSQVAVVKMTSRIINDSIEIQFKYSRPEEDSREYLQMLNEGDAPVKSKYFIEKSFVVPMVELPKQISDKNIRMRISIEEI